MGGGLLEEVSGVLIGGGTDIDPLLYGSSKMASVPYDLERDALEIKIIEQALKNNIPLFGICRGAQLINVVLGGSLHQDIRPMRTFTPNRHSIRTIKVATIEASTQLHNIVGVSDLPINSLHSQAVDRLATELKVSARDKDGFIQGFEVHDDRFIMGVQWHPEYLPYIATHRNIFRTFAHEIVHRQGL